MANLGYILLGLTIRSNYFLANFLKPLIKLRNVATLDIKIVCIVVDFSSAILELHTMFCFLIFQIKSSDSLFWTFLTSVWPYVNLFMTETPGSQAKFRKSHRFRINIATHLKSISWRICYVAMDFRVGNSGFMFSNCLTLSIQLSLTRVLMKEYKNSNTT